VAPDRGSVAPGPALLFWVREFPVWDGDGEVDEVDGVDEVP